MRLIFWASVGFWAGLRHLCPDSHVWRLFGANVILAIAVWFFRGLFGPGFFDEPEKMTWKVALEFWIYLVVVVLFFVRRVRRAWGICVMIWLFIRRKIHRMARRMVIRRAADVSRNPPENNGIEMV